VQGPSAARAGNIHGRHAVASAFFADTLIDRIAEISNPMDRIINAIAAGIKGNKSSFTCFSGSTAYSVELSVLDTMAEKVAGRLWNRGIRPGDRIGILSRNRLEWVLLDLAAIKLGAVTAGFDYSTIKPTPQLLADYELKLLFTDRGASAPGLVDIQSVSENASEGERTALPLTRYKDDDCTTIKFTSGSTGAPKGLAATVSSIDSSISAVQELFHHTSSDKIMVFLPLSLLQQRYWVYSALYYGHSIVVSTYELAFQTLLQADPSVVMGVPSFFDAAKRQIEVKIRLSGSHRDEPGTSESSPSPDQEQRKLFARKVLGKGIRYLWTGSAPANPATLRFFLDCDMPIFEGYGMNETCIVTKNCPEATKIGSVGRPLRDKKVQIREDGMVIVSSHHPVNTRYLYAAAGESEKFFQPNGDVLTGDLGYIDDDGYLFISGRADDVIALGNGKNVRVRRVEEKVKEHPGIEECVLYGAGRAYLIALISVTSNAVEADVKSHIDSVNSNSHPEERLGKVLICDERFTIENGFLTSQYKPRRKKIYEKYATAIEKLYREVAS
jgi:long-chain acyl-CoA synthetase